jgi:molecular chaperone GrpE
MVPQSNRPRGDQQPEQEAAASPSETPLTDSPQSASPESDAGEAQDQLSQLTAQLSEAQTRALRAQAELENFRKRSRRELEDQQRYATLPLLVDLLGVVDNLQLAIRSAEQHDDQAGLLEGVKMVSRQLTEVLKKHHCEEIAAEGQPFDPHAHEAVLQQPSDQYPAGTVSQVTRSGYRLYDRVIRPSQVFVSSGPPQAAEGES